MARGYGVGGGLAEAGLQQRDDAMRVLGQAAQDENTRQITNKQVEANRKAGNAQLGSALGGLAGGAIAGATYGSAAGPIGMAIGGLIGALGSQLF